MNEPYDPYGAAGYNAERPRTNMPTKPPTPAETQEAHAFEALIKAVGEGRARWSRLLALLEERSE